MERLLILYFSSNQSIYDQQYSQFKMLDNWQIGLQIDFLIYIIFALAAGFVIGAERESRGKPAGISTNSLVIGGSMLFTYLSAAVDPNSTSRIAAQVVSGIGFLGADE